jgi:hypothetical protein
MDVNNQKQFIAKIAEELHITSVEDWQKVTLDHIMAKGGRGLLRIYNGSYQRGTLC